MIRKHSSDAAMATVNPGNSGARLSATAAFAPVDLGEPSDAASLVIDQKHMEDYLKTDMHPGIVQCARPPKGTFFTVLPEKPNETWGNRAFYFLLEPAGRDPYLVSSTIANKKKDDEDTLGTLVDSHRKVAVIVGWPAAYLFAGDAIGDINLPSFGNVDEDQAC